MGWLQKRNNQNDEVDEHDEPTEPIPARPGSPFAPTMTNNGGHIDALPTRKLPEYPMSQQQTFSPDMPGSVAGGGNIHDGSFFTPGFTSPYAAGAMNSAPTDWAAPGFGWDVQDAPAGYLPGGGGTVSGSGYAPSWGGSPAGATGVPVYPVLPPAPGYNGPARPPGGASAKAARQRATRPRWRLRFITALVGMLFLAIQILLLMRFVLIYVTLPWQGAATAVNVIVVWSNVCMLPFQPLLQRISLPIPIDSGIYLLAAILVYGIVGRIVRLILRLALRTR